MSAYFSDLAEGVSDDKPFQVYAIPCGLCIHHSYTYEVWGAFHFDVLADEDVLIGDGYGRGFFAQRNNDMHAD